MINRPPSVASLLDFRAIARRQLPSFLFEYVDGGSFAEITMRENLEAWASLRLRQFVMRDASSLDTAGSFLGQRARIPVALAPVGLAGMLKRRGEVQAALAAKKMGVPFCLSTVSLCSLEEVQKATGAPFWFQLYMLKDRGVVAELLQRAKAAGCNALIVTADLSQVGVRYSDIRNGVGLKSTLRSMIKRALSIAARPAWAKDVALGGGPLVFGNLAQYAPSAKNPENLKAWAAAQFDPSMHWKDLDWVRSKWDGPIVLKGVLEPDDAVWAASAGVQAVVVSNHGGRQLDCASATARALPRIAQATKGTIELWVDGGLRFGHDVIKAIALGATGTLIGRPWAWALAAGGESGVHDALTMLETEIKVSLGLTGYRSLSELTLDSLVPLFPGVFGPTEHNGRLT